jgi:beta-lactamase regulating signal transducer with metallopeptidase domain
MISEIFSAESFFWSGIWQSTVFIAAGLLGSFIIRHRSARAHQVLLLAIIAAVIVPIMSILVKHYELGLFTARLALIQPQPEDQIIYDTTEITSVENIEHKSGTVEKDLTSVINASESTKFPLRSVILYGWLITSLILTARLLITFILGARLLARAIPLDCDRIEQAVLLAKAKLRIDKDVSFYSSQGVQSPVIWCWKRKPILLLPSAAGLSENRIDWAGVLCHELAHYKRHDHISGLFAELLACIMPWHPLLWWAKSRLTSLSEQACDDWVVATCQPCTDYAESLLDLTPCDQMAFVPAVVSSKKGLAGRIQRILKNNRPNPRTGAIWALAVGIVAICITFGVAFAQTRPAKMEEVKIETQQVQEEQKNNTLPVSWKLDYDDGLLPDGGKRWPNQMAENLASLKFVPTPASTLDVSRKDEEYRFWLHSLQGNHIGQNTLTLEPEDTKSNLKILKPDKYLLKYERKWGKPGNNFRMRCGEFLVDVSEPGMYELRFTPKLWTAEITGSLGGCYAINFEKVGKGPRIRGFAYQHGKPYLLDGLPAGKYRLSAVTQRQSDNVFVSQAEVTVGAKKKATVDIVPAPKGSCSLHGYILGKQNKYKTPWPTSPESQGKWFILIRKPGSGVVEWVDAYEALTMDSLYVVRGINIIQETDDRTRYHIEGVASGKYTVTAIENPSWAGCVVTRQKSKLVTLKANEKAMLDFDLRGTKDEKDSPSAETNGANTKPANIEEVKGSRKAESELSKSNSLDAPRVLVLDNCDSDYKTPPFQDNIIMLNSKGGLIKKIVGLNICQNIGGCRAISTSEDGRFFVVSENVAHRLTMFETASGKVLWSLSGRFSSAVIADGIVYAIASLGPNRDDAVFAIDSTGTIIKQASIINGFDIVADPDHGCLWLVGADIKKCNLDLQVLLTIDPINWYAVSVDLNDDGSIWVAERTHSEVKESKNRLLKISQKGIIQKSIDLNWSPRCVRVDKSNGSVWITGKRYREFSVMNHGLWHKVWAKTHKYDPQGKLLLKIDKGGNSIDIDSSDNSVWIIGRQKKLWHYSENGKMLGTYNGVSDDQKWISVVP